MSAAVATETPKEAARRFASKKLREGFQPSALHEYQDVEGRAIYWRIRAKHSETGEKWIRPMRRNGCGFELGEPKFDGPKPLYRIPDIIHSPNAPVFVVEGENCADGLAKLNIVATTSGSSDSASKADWSPVADRDVILWPDNDEAGLGYAKDVHQRIGEVVARLRVVDVGQLGLPAKGDCIDWLQAHSNATATDILALPMAEVPASSAGVVTQGQEETQRRKSQATELIELADDLELFHSEDEGYVILLVSGHKETWPLRSKHFRDFLTRQYYLAHRRSPGAQAVEDALRTLSGKARFECREETVHVRVARHDDAIYIDLADDEWRSIKITDDGWQVVRDPPVRFLRHKGLLPLPEPGKGDLPALWGFLNVTDEQQQRLVAAWLVQALNPRGPYPVLVLQGEQGTAKSTLARALRSLCDPSVVMLRTVPRDERDLMIWAQNGWVIALDNLSGLPPWLSDSLCRLSTGGGFSTRQLYSDTDEVLIDAQRPLILNGIDDIATRQDLIDRAIILNLDPIPEEARKPEATFWAGFETVRPAVLGALIDAVSGALRELPRTKLKKTPRMADFALFATAAESSLGWESGTFMAAYSANRQNAVEAGLEGSPVANALRELMRSRDGWEGTATELLTTLEAQTDEKVWKLRSWPKAPRGLSNQLRRLATALRMVGIHIEFVHSGDRKIYIRNSPKLASGASVASKPRQEEAFGPDANEPTASNWTQNAPARTQRGRNADRLEASSGAGLDAKDAADAKIRPRSHEPADGDEDGPREVVEL